MYTDVNLEDQQSEASLQAPALSSTESICIINEASDNHRCFHVCALFQQYLKAAPSVLLESPFPNPQLWISTDLRQKPNKLFIISVTVFFFFESSTNKGQIYFVMNKIVVHMHQSSSHNKAALTTKHYYHKKHEVKRD